jgi:hypothetical protein
LAGIHVGEQPEFAMDILLAPEHDVGALQEDAALRCRRDALLAAIEELHAQRAFEHPDRARQARLRNADRFGGAREIAVLGKLQRAAEQS